MLPDYNTKNLIPKHGGKFKVFCWSPPQPAPPPLSLLLQVTSQGILHAILQVTSLFLCTYQSTVSTSHLKAHEWMVKAKLVHLSCWIWHWICKACATILLAFIMHSQVGLYKPWLLEPDEPWLSLQTDNMSLPASVIQSMAVWARWAMIVLVVDNICWARCSYMCYTKHGCLSQMSKKSSCIGQNHAHSCMNKKCPCLSMCYAQYGCLSKVPSCSDKKHMFSSLSVLGMISMCVSLACIVYKFVYSYVLQL